MPQTLFLHHYMINSDIAQTHWRFHKIVVKKTISPLCKKLIIAVQIK